MDNLWKQEYLLDLDEIDEQHKKFFTICSMVAHRAEIASCDREFIVDVIKSIGLLRTYAFLHFKTEEELMLNYGFSDFLFHTSLHNKYLAKMMEYEGAFKELHSQFAQGKLDEEKLREFLLEMSHFIVEWWSSHILTQDSQYAEHIKEKKEKHLG